MSSLCIYIRECCLSFSNTTHTEESNPMVEVLNFDFAQSRVYTIEQIFATNEMLILFVWNEEAMI